MAKDGKTNPLNVLKETLNAFIKRETNSENVLYSCIFRGRFLLLKRKWLKIIPNEVCTDYESWIKNFYNMEVFGFGGDFYF